jgi:hypothetical protein
MAYPYRPPVQNIFLTVNMADVGTADSRWIVPGFQGRVRAFWSVINGAITGVDSTASLAIGAAATAVTGSTITVTQSGSAAGDVDVARPTALNVFGSTDAIKIINNGESTGTQPVVFTLELEPV